MSGIVVVICPHAVDLTVRRCALCDSVDQMTIQNLRARLDEAVARVEREIAKLGPLYHERDVALADLSTAEMRAHRYRTFLELVAAPKRPDGTYNRSREECERLAKEALRDAQGGGT